MTLPQEWLESDHQAVDKKDSIGRVQAWVHGESDVRPVVVDGGKPFAIINIRPFLSRAMHHDTKIDKVANPVPILRRSHNLQETVRRFHTSLAPYLPVTDEDGLAGVVTALRVLAETFESGPTAGEAAVTVPVLSLEDRIEQATNLFQQSPVEHLPVMNRNGRLVGAVPRSTVARVMHGTASAMGRKDRAGESTDLGAESVLGYMEEGWDEAPEDLRFTELVSRLEEQPTVFVRGRDGFFLGAVSAPLLLRAAAERDERFTVHAETRPPVPASKDQRR